MTKLGSLRDLKCETLAVLTNEWTFLEFLCICTDLFGNFEHLFQNLAQSELGELGFKSELESELDNLVVKTLKTINFDIKKLYKNTQLDKF